MKAIVIAGNYRVYAHWIDRWQLKKEDFVYVEDADKLRGLERGTKCILLYGHWDSPIQGHNFDSIKYRFKFIDAVRLS
jgi:hypothetical protein